MGPANPHKYYRMTKFMFCFVKSPHWFGSKSKIGGAQLEHVIKIMWFHLIPFSGVGGVTEKRWVHPA